MTITPVQGAFASAASATAATSAAGDASATAGVATADFNVFLRLLVAQLKNQDPMKPMDPTQTVTQLATFASVEQATQTNALLSQLSDMSALSQASALIGRSAASADGSVKGVVASVTMTTSGLVATLKDGSRLALGPGVTVS